MTILNISLCLPEWDVAAITQGHSIVAITARFIVPGKSFALLPCRDSSTEGVYHHRFKEQIESSLPSKSESVAATHWAQCTSCQQVPDEEGIASLSSRAIWTQAALVDHLEAHGRLFLSFLKAYELPKAISAETEPVCKQTYKFLPLLKSVEADTQNPVLTEEQFAVHKQALLESSDHDRETLPEVTEDQSDSLQSNPTEDILNSPNWISKISEVGNSSDGHTFEKLVRKGLIELGFDNTLNRAEVSLDPSVTGGAGGIDFYADKPYSLLGECKATSTDKVKDPSTQLHRLGLKYLSKEIFERSIKLILAAGKLTAHADKIAKGHQINVIRPETFQSLIEINLNHSGAIDLSDLKAYLQMPPFGMEADEKLKNAIDQRRAELKQNEQYIQQRVQIVETIQELSAQTIHRGKKAFVVVEIRAHYNAKHEPAVTDEEAQAMLAELSSPIYGYLGRKHISGDRERFYFLKQLPTQS